MTPMVVAFLRRLLPLLPAEPEPHAVGGFVRDALLGRATHDLDITVGADALAVARRLADALGGAFVPLDEPRQVARAVVRDGDETWLVDVASLQGDRMADLARRDFTVDAMSVALSALLTEEWSGHVLDPFGGRTDLESGMIRAVSPAVFQEDGLRLLRAVRLAASLGFDIEPTTRDLIRRDAGTLAGVSAERVRDEFLAILASGQAMRHVYLMDDLTLLCRVVPELEDGRGVTQPKEHYWDVLHHSIETVGVVEGLLERTWEPEWVLEAIPWDDALAARFQEVVGEGHTRSTFLKLAGLLHDIAKPATRTVDEEGRIRFKGHQSQGATIAQAVLGRLRLSRKTIDMIAAQIEHHLRPAQMSQEAELATPKAVYRYFRSAGDVAIDTLYLNLADYLAARGPLLEREEWAAYTAKVRHIMVTGLAQEQPLQTPPLLDGHALMGYFHLLPGPLVGRLLEVVREAQATGEVATREQALALAQQTISTEKGESV
ncbi:MAG: HD domain-containing protein [Chloroflexota bacterium]